jgi:DNA-binding CsgD family transcriptional regulator
MAAAHDNRAPGNSECAAVTHAPQLAPTPVQQLPLFVESASCERVPVSPTAPRAARRAANEVREITANDLAGLSANERRLLNYAAIGLSDKQIADTVKRSYRTVSTQMGVLRRKLRMRTRFQLGFCASKLLATEKST